MRDILGKVKQEDIDSFWSCVIKGKFVDDCWAWAIDNPRYARTPGGYVAHRLSYYIHNGPFDESLIVRHLCHNKLCTNPRHLAVGTQKDNMNDSRRANRMGWQTSYLSNYMVKAIREGLGMSLYEFGEAILPSNTIDPEGRMIDIELGKKAVNNTMEIRIRDLTKEYYDSKGVKAINAGCKYQWRRIGAQM